MKFATVATLAVAASAMRVSYEFPEENKLAQIDIKEEDKAEWLSAAARAGYLLARYGPKALKMAVKYGPSVVEAVQSLLG